MKILYIFTLSLISGPVDCADVTGYSGGSVIILANVKWDSSHSKYVQKLRERNFTEIIHLNSKEDHVTVGRFTLYSNSRGYMTVFIRKLKPQDAGMYRIGTETKKSTNVNLIIVSDTSCAGPKITNTYQGWNTSIICNYPGAYERKNMYITKLDSDSVVQDILYTATKSQSGRFSVSDDRSAKVLSVNISDVREADDGVYLCGVLQQEGSVHYYSYFTEIQLRVGDTTITTFMMTSAESTKIPPDEVYMSSSIICMGGCVALLCGGFALLAYTLRHKRTHDSTPTSTDKVQAPSVYENDLVNLPPYENMNMAARLNHQNLDSFTNQSDSAYATLDPLTNQSDSGYRTLTNITVQSHSHYQSLNPRTQTNSVYYTLQF